MSHNDDIRHQLDIAAVGEHYQTYIRDGMPEVGWQGDPWMVLVYNKLQDRFEVWQQKPGRDPVAVLRAKPMVEGVPSIEQLCLLLAKGDHNGRNVEQFLADLDAHNEQLLAARQAEAQEQSTEALRRVAFYLARENGEPRVYKSMHTSDSEKVG
jgi:hypothetical protein